MKTQAIEDYLKAIHDLERDHGRAATTAIAAMSGQKAATQSRSQRFVSPPILRRRAMTSARLAVSIRQQHNPPAKRIQLDAGCPFELLDWLPAWFPVAIHNLDVNGRQSSERRRSRP